MRTILLAAVALASCSCSNSIVQTEPKTDVINEAAFNGPILEDLISDLNRRQAGLFTQERAIYVLRVKQGEQLKVMANIFYRGDFAWYQTNETDIPLGLASFNGNDVLLFGETVDSLYSLSSTQVAREYLSKREVSPLQYGTIDSESYIYIIDATATFNRISECNVFLHDDC